MAISDRLQDYLPVVTQLLNQSGGSGYNYNPVAPTSVQGGIVETGTRQNPTIRPAIPVSGPNQQLPKVVGTVTNPGMVGRNVDVGAGSGMQPVLEDDEALEKWGKSKKVVAKDAPEGLARNALGLLDFVTLGIADFDKRGNLFGGEHLPGLRPGSGYGGQAEYEAPPQTPQQVMAPDGSIYDPSTRTWSRPSAVLSDKDFNKLIQQTNQYRDATQGSRLAQRSADFQAGLNEVKQFLPYIQDQILGARLATEAQSPSEIQNRMKTATSALAQDRISMAAMQDAASRYVQATAPIRGFGRA